MTIQRNILRAVSTKFLIASLLLGCSSEVSKEVDGGSHEIDGWERKFGTNGDQTVASLAVSADGAIALTGSFEQSIDFGNGKLTSAGDTNVFVAVLEPSGVPRWSAGTATGIQRDDSHVAFTPDGGLFLAGDFIGEMSFGQVTLSAKSGAFLFRFDSAGKVLWSKKLGGDTGDVSVGGIGLAPDGGVVVGGQFDDIQSFGGEVFSGDHNAFVVRYDPQGKHVFSRAFSSTGSYVEAIAVDPKGAVILGGSSNNPITFGKAVSEVGGFVGRLEPDGTPAWVTHLGGPDGTVSSVVLGPDGDVVVGGDDYFLLPGDDISNSVGFVTKLSASGTTLWSQSFKSASYPSPVHVNAVGVDAAGHTFLTGFADGSTDFGGGPVADALSATGMFLLELDPSGAYVKSKRFTGSGQSLGSALAVDPEGGLVYSVEFDGTLEGTTQVHQSQSEHPWADILIVRQPR